MRPRSSVIPVNGNGSSIDALADSQLQIQLAFSTWFNSVLLNSHLAVESSIKELSVVSMCVYLCGEEIKTLHCQCSVYLVLDMTCLLHSGKPK